MAKILMLTPQPPYPPHQGTSLRNWHVLRALAEHHEVTLLTFQEIGKPVDIEKLNAVAEKVISVQSPERTKSLRFKQLISTGEPDMALRLNSDTFAISLTELLLAKSFDAVQIEGIELARYIALIRSHHPTIRIVLDCHNAETELQRRAFETDLYHPARWPAAIYSLIQAGRLRDFEKQVCLSADRIITVSESDRSHLIRLLAPERREVEIIPNTIDIAEYAWSEPPKTEFHFDLLFTGKMDYRPNVDGVLWFADEVWPLIRNEVPDITWGIVGQNPHPRLNRLCKQAGITITGWVESIHPYLAGATIFITPLRIGSGTRLKIIEAMSARKPIVSTRVGAEGFPVENDREVVIADTPVDMAREIIALIRDDKRQERLGAAAYQLAQRYDWRSTIAVFDRVYANL